MITLTIGAQKRSLLNTALPGLCLDLCGGGYTPKQTADAMLMQDKVLDGDVVTFKFRGTPASIQADFTKGELI